MGGGASFAEHLGQLRLYRRLASAETGEATTISFHFRFTVLSIYLSENIFIFLFFLVGADNGK